MFIQLQLLYACVSDVSFILAGVEEVERLTYGHKQTITKKEKITSTAQLQDAGQQSVERMASADAAINIVMPSSSSEPQVNDRYFPQGPQTSIPIAITEKDLWETFEKEAAEEEAIVEEERKELAEALALDARRQPAELQGSQSSKGKSPDIARIGMSTKIATLRSSLEMAVSDCKAELLM